MEFARKLSLALIALTACLLLRRPGRYWRLLALPPILLVHQPTSMWPQWVRMDRMFRGEVQHLTTQRYVEIFDRRQFLTPDVRSFDDLYNRLETNLAAQLPQLRAQREIEDEAHLRAIYYVNAVSNLWHFGNFAQPDRTGCVLINEKTGFKEIPSERITARTYFDSEIACCVDYAYTLRALFERARIPNRLVSMIGHMANEVKVKSGWLAVDASSGMMLNRSWQEITANPELIPSLTLFPIAAVRKGSALYSPAAGGLRLALLSIATHDSFITPDYSYELPTWFMDRPQKVALRAPQH